ncbi:ImmA/IrrE family metallo-endopeptidase [Candidatus Poribacteria bacterium]|nr:ImmA/IrrE family metallo-endopeptidase [Candidatus Poribacteria bacterium]
MPSKLPLSKQYAETTLVEYFKLSNIVELSLAHLSIPVKDIADSHYRIYVGRSDSLAAKLPDSVQKRWMNASLSGLLLVGSSVKEIWVSAAEAERSQGRERFTIAHELGHFLLHSDESTSASIFFACREKDIHSTVSNRNRRGKESEANRFAAELLMPERLVEQLAQRWKASIPKMAHRFDVSAEAMGIRLTQLGFPPVL